MTDVAMQQGAAAEPKVSVHSIAQRTMVPNNLSGSLTVATVPWDDVGSHQEDDQSGDSRTLHQLSSQLFGTVSTQALDDDQYARAVRLIRSARIWKSLQRDYLDLYYRFLGEDERDARATQSFERLTGRFQQFGNLLGMDAEQIGEALAYDSYEDMEEADRVQPRFAEHTVIYMLEGRKNHNIAQATLYPDDVPIEYAFTRSSGAWAQQVLNEHDLNQETFLLALDIYTTAINPSYRVRATLSELDRFHIPFGNSPQISLRELGEILRNGWRTVFALIDVDVAMKRATSPYVSLTLIEDNVVIQSRAPEVISQLTAETKKSYEEDS